MGSFGVRSRLYGVHIQLEGRSALRTGIMSNRRGRKRAAAEAPAPGLDAVEQAVRKRFGDALAEGSLQLQTEGRAARVLFRSENDPEGSPLVKGAIASMLEKVLSSHKAPKAYKMEEPLTTMPGYGPVLLLCCPFPSLPSPAGRWCMARHRTHPSFQQN
jgi:hypothetical protein